MSYICTNKQQNDTVMANLETLTDRQLAKLIAEYNGQKGTEKQVGRLVKFYQTKEMMINFLKPRLN